MGPGAERRRLPASVLALGVVSLLTDVSSEMIFPLLPAFLAARVASAPLVLGAMEGLADLVSAGCKWWAGQWVDRARRLRPMVFSGYALSSLARPLMALVTSWWQPLLVRSIDRVGKGLRGAPRDVMIAGWADPSMRARAFGLNRAMDHAGAALGALVAAVLVARGLSVERVFLLAAIPGALAVVAIFFSREPPEHPRAKAGQPLAPVPRRLGFYLGPVALFALANSTDAFLLLRLTEQGASPALLPLAWLSLHAVKAAVSFPAGALADRLGSARLVGFAWALYGVSYVALALSPSLSFTLGAIAFYGLYHAMSEGAERALLVELSPLEARGRAFGLYHALTGIGSLAAGLLFGGLWMLGGSKVAFLAAAGLSALAFGFLLLWLPKARAA